MALPEQISVLESMEVGINENPAEEWDLVLTAVVLAQRFAYFIQRSDLIERQPHNSALLGQRLQNRLANPPYGMMIRQWLMLD